MRKKKKRREKPKALSKESFRQINQSIMYLCINVLNDLIASPVLGLSRAIVY